MTTRYEVQTLSTTRPVGLPAGASWSHLEDSWTTRSTWDTLESARSSKNYYFAYECEVARIISVTTTREEVR